MLVLEYLLSNVWAVIFILIVSGSVIDSMLKSYGDLRRIKRLEKELENLQAIHNREKFGQAANHAQYEARRQAEAARRYQEAVKESRPTWYEVKNKYRIAMKLNHPDVIRANGGTDREIEGATIICQELNKQYEKSKKEYK